jgi:hypothetical protein
MMFRHALILSTNVEVYDEIRTNIVDWLSAVRERGDYEGPGPVITHDRSVDDARLRIDRFGDVDLLITDLDVAPTSDDAVNPGDSAGLAFVKDLRAAGHRMAVVVIPTAAPVNFAKLRSELHAMERCEVVAWGAGTDTGESLKKSLDRLRLCLSGAYPQEFDAQNARSEENPLVAEIIVMFHTEQALYQINYTTAEDQAPPYPIPLKIDKDKLMGLLSKNDEVAKPGNPYALNRLQEVGRDLGSLLFGNVNFAQDFGSLMSLAGDLSRVHMAFLVNKDVYPVHLEALYDDDHQWWMLEGPITRRVDIRTPVRPLSADTPLNCLIIEANYAGQSDEFGTLKLLANVPDECETLEKTLRKLKAAGQEGTRIGKIVRLPDPKKGLMGAASMHALVRDVLTGKPPGAKRRSKNVFHIVHFAGHTVYDRKTNRAHLIFPAADGVSPDPVDFQAFGRWLREAQTCFVYLSHCHHPEHEITYELASQKIPAVVGFRIDIENEDLAAKHARLFYEYLLVDRVPLDRAFFRARRRLRDEHPMEAAWAAPLMVCQP